MSYTKRDCKAFAAAYLECALWSSTDNADETGGEPLDRNYCCDDIAPAAKVRAFRDCLDFIDANAEMMAATGATAEQHGHDFWLTRNHHGAGFWDRGYGKRGDKLTDAAHVYGSCDLEVGDDGRIYGF